jgi:hypothetical protein
MADKLVGVNHAKSRASTRLCVDTTLNSRALEDRQKLNSTANGHQSSWLRRIAATTVLLILFKIESNTA